MGHPRRAQAAQAAQRSRQLFGVAGNHPRPVRLRGPGPPPGHSQAIAVIAISPPPKSYAYAYRLHFHPAFLFAFRGMASLEIVRKRAIRGGPACPCCEAARRRAASSHTLNMAAGSERVPSNNDGSALRPPTKTYPLSCEVADTSLLVRPTLIWLCCTHTSSGLAPASPFHRAASAASPAE